MKLKATKVFQKNWDAIHEPCPVCEIGVKDCEWCSGSGRKYKYIINEGASRSGKTFSLLDCYDLFARSNPNLRGTIWRDTKIDCKRTVLQDLIKHHRATNRFKNGYTYNKTESIFEYENGTLIEIHGADEDDKVHGLTQDFAWMNEPYKISRTIFDQIDQRTSLFVFLDWNPKMSHFIDDLKKNKRTKFIKSTFRDNPFCPPAQRAKILSYQPISKSAAVIGKKLTADEVRNYDFLANEKDLSSEELDELKRCLSNEEINTANDFNWSVYGLGDKGERENRILSFEKISERRFDEIDSEIIYGVDWGKVDPWGIVAVKYYDGCLFLREINYASENILMQKMTANEINNIRSNDEGIVSWMFNKHDIKKDAFIVCDNNRPEKIIALRRAGWEYALAARKPKGSILEGIDTLTKLDVFYTENSLNLEEEQENYSRKVDRYGIVLEEPEDNFNHLIDPIRYVVSHLIHEGVIKSI